MAKYKVKDADLKRAIAHISAKSHANGVLNPKAHLQKKVTEEQIMIATRSLAEDAHLVAEPSGAVTLAAVQQHAKRFEGQSVVAVVSGGNLSFGDCRLGSTKG